MAIQFDYDKLNQDRCVKGREVMAHVKEMCADPMGINTHFLMELLEKNKDTAFGREHHFSEIKTIEDYQKMVPVGVYDNFAPYIERMTRGEKNMLTADEVVHYNITSGTTGVPKRIPLTQKAMANYMYYGESLIYGLLDELPDDRWKRGRRIMLMECPDTIGHVEDGTTCDILSFKLNTQHKKYYPIFNTSPMEAAFPRGDYETRYIHALFALKDRNASCLAFTFSSHCLEFLRYLRKTWPMLCDDIENGCVNKAYELPDDIRASLDAQLTPDPERAAELRTIFKEKKQFVPYVWPNMTNVNSVATGSFRTYAERLINDYMGPDIHWYNIGLCASEGMYSVPEALDSQYSMFIPDNMFYELLPVETEDDLSTICTLDQVEVGKEYELVCTTLSGLYRYRQADVVRIVGFKDRMPLMEFVCRKGNVIEMFAEKTSEKHLIDAVDGMAHELSLDVVDFSVYPNMEAGTPRYDVLLELANSDEVTVPVETMAEVLTKYLYKANILYYNHVMSKDLAPLKLQLLQDQTNVLYKEMLAYKGWPVAQIKPVHIIRNETQRKFFFGLVKS
ncbi:MAG: GH3 auxin-responsive promoter family protein [Lachnospiraceae bacterium]|nr:GH3 auxin-responsive promoter family protein [Lachnospiraceae bacterium]